MGYLIQYRNPGRFFDFFGNAIVKRQLMAGIDLIDACFVHIEISGGEEDSVNISPPISKRIDITKTHKGRFARLIRYKNTEYEQGKRYKVAYFSAVLCNKPYDIKGILAFVIKWIKEDKNKPFCSEGALWSFRMVFSDIMDGMKLSECMPGHFSEKTGFETVWEGVI